MAPACSVAVRLNLREDLAACLEQEQLCAAGVLATDAITSSTASIRVSAAVLYWNCWLQWSHSMPLVVSTIPTLTNAA